jgi:14-3-3 protein epsilon
MQLLRDNLTLWTSSDGGEPDAAAGEAAKTEAAEKAPEAEKPADKPAEEAAPAPAS